MPTLLLTAAAVIDAQGFSAAPGALLLEVSTFDALSTRPGHVPDTWCRSKCLLAGTVAEVVASPQSVGTRRIDLPHSILIPALVNAHTHLDLTHLGPRAHDAASGFSGFARLVMRNRPRDEAAVRASVREGVRLSLAGGVVGVGDIAGMVTPTLTTWATDELGAGPLMGTSFLEFFAMAGAAIERLDSAIAPARQLRPASSRVRVGLSPHAPYSVSARGYQHAMDLRRGLNLPVSTHLAESTHERDAVVHARGPAIDLLQSLGVYDDEARQWLGHARSPVDRLSEVIARARETRAAPLSLVHCNDLSDADLDVIASSDASVIYCPRSSAYFDAPAAFGPHRYRDLLARSVNVALGTDSIINLPERLTRISPWDEAVFLHRRDGLDARTLLAMITSNAARAIGLPAAAFSFSDGEPESASAGVVALEVGEPAGRSGARMLEAAMSSEVGPRLMVLGSLD